MFPGRYFPARYFTGRYWPKGDAETVPTITYDVIVMGAVSARTLATVGTITATEGMNLGAITQPGD